MPIQSRTRPIPVREYQGSGGVALGDEEQTVAIPLCGYEGSREIPIFFSLREAIAAPGNYTPLVARYNYEYSVNFRGFLLQTPVLRKIDPRVIQDAIESNSPGVYVMSWDFSRPTDSSYWTTQLVTLRSDVLTLSSRSYYSFENDRDCRVSWLNALKDHIKARALHYITLSHDRTPILDLIA